MASIGYAIIKDGLYYSNMSEPCFRSPVAEVGEIYFYTSELRAQDVANQLGGEVVEFDYTSIYDEM